MAELNYTQLQIQAVCRRLPGKTRGASAFGLRNSSGASSSSPRAATAPPGGRRPTEPKLMPGSLKVSEQGWITSAGASTPLAGNDALHEIAMKREADVLWAQIQRGATNPVISPGQLHRQFVDRGISTEGFAALFYRLDADGDDAISKTDWYAGYTRFVRRGGFSTLQARGDDVPALEKYGPEKLAASEQKAQALLAPKLAQLKAAFTVFDRLGTGKVSLTWLNAMSTVVMRQAGRPPSARTPQGPEAETVPLTFDVFRSILARQPEELLGSASAGAGKKGKKKK